MSNRPSLREMRLNLRRSAQGVSKRLNLNGIEKHIFLCAESKCKCAPLQQGLGSWQYLKDRLRQLRLVAPAEKPRVMRTKANCLQVCAEGPIAVVYEVGGRATWYKECTPETLEAIIQSHILNDEPLQSHILSHSSSQEENQEEAAAS